MTRLRLFAMIAGLMVLLVLPQLGNNYIAYILNLILVNCLIGIGLNIVLGYAGQFAFVSAALTGLGAYAAAIVTTRFGLSFWIALPCAALLASAVGLISAIPAIKTSRVYLALVTLAFAELVQWGFVHWKAVTAGTDGLGVSPPSLFGVAIVRDDQRYYLLLVAVILVYVLVWRLLHTRFGRSLIAIRTNEVLAACNGISVAGTKLGAFALSGFVTGIGGAFFALTTGHISPTDFSLNMLVMQFSVVVIGGLASLPGSIIGAIVITALPELLREAQSMQEIIYGVVLMVCIVVMPKGIAGFFTRIRLISPEILVGRWRGKPIVQQASG